MVPLPDFIIVLIWFILTYFFHNILKNIGNPLGYPMICTSFAVALINTMKDFGNLLILFIYLFIYLWYFPHFKML